ncbi:A/G-specific adenine glycosylase [Lysinibacter cavernae]|nr:A/G-specific adenine glycosylase [Lysinibacter cavernae]
MQLWTKINPWFEANGRDLPWREPGFSAWGTLVSEFMLQQTQVSRVIPKLEDFLNKWPTPIDLAESPASDAVRAWDRLGYPRRALWLHRAATTIAEQHNGVVPRDVDALLALTGVGDYTARAVAVFAYGDRHPVVDTNTRRVIARAVHGRGEAAPPQATTDLADMEALMPAEDGAAAVFNAGMMELGAIVCTAKKPLCDECPLATVCAWRASGYPAYEGKKRATQKRFEGSDRQVRGLIMAAARAADTGVTDTEIVALWADAEQRDRALASLIRDGLLVPQRSARYVLAS